MDKKMLIDSHCHLDFNKFKDQKFKDFFEKKHNIESILDRAKEVGISHILAISTTLEDSKETVKNVNKYDAVKCFASVGIHPHEAQNHLEKYSSHEIYHKLEELIDNPLVISVGECGLDYHFTQETKKQQREVFELQCDLSKKHDIPLEIHVRDAEDDTFSILKTANCRGVIHCFTGTLEFAKLTLDLGYYISFSGVVTFKNASKLREIVSYAPLEKVLLETDAPFLAPTPCRGMVNEPAYMTKIAECIAAIKNVSLEEICNVTSHNFFTVFNKGIE